MTAATTAPSVAAERVFRPSPTARLISAFSGTRGVAVKIAFLSAVNAIAIWAEVVLIGRSSWIAVVVLALATAAIDAVYLARRRTLPLKFLVPGTVFLLAFVLIPILYTINVAFTNYSTGHVISKPDAIAGIEQNSLQPPANGRQFTMAPAKDAHGNLVLILRDDAKKQNFVGTPKALTPLPADAVTENAAGITAAKGYTLVKGSELFGIDAQLRNYTVPTSGSNAIRPQGLGQAVELAPTLRYDAARDEFVRISDGQVFRDNHLGSFVAANGQELEPGWKTYVGFRNFTQILHNPLVRQPFLHVFIWTISFAVLTVFFSFAIGLFLAIALDKRGMHLQRIYRSILVIPFAMPSFLSLLVWQGLLNDQFGVVNRDFHLSVPWLFDANWAKVSVIFVSVWLTVPYFFLVAMGALQSIPAELVEAARVDGGGPFQVFRRVTLPLLLVVTAPLLIASFAFNFNNFGNIYFLTNGGPPVNNSPIAGATDILISYTYKLAIATGKGGDYGLASAVSILIFFIVAIISGVSFWRTKSLEAMA
jgi:arabinogalactan oligomer/maltooligosaccharide transport system permease protein